MIPLDLRFSERADQNCADEQEGGANRHDVELQSNVHEGGSMAIYDDSTLPEKSTFGQTEAYCDAVSAQAVEAAFLKALSKRMYLLRGL